MPLFMVVEHFRNGDAAPVIAGSESTVEWRPMALRTSRVRSTKIWQPATNSWKANRTLLDEWIRNWKDLPDFEVHPVISSQEAAQRVASLEA